jgi:curved DNA-binding protein CbpA
LPCHLSYNRAIRTHPDRLVNASPSEKQAATERFQASLFSITSRKDADVPRQAVADAYYVLSDPQRRKEYDALYCTQSNRSDNPNSTFDFFSHFANMFGGATGTNTGQPDAEGVFADVFEEVSAVQLSTSYPI